MQQTQTKQPKGGKRKSAGDQRGEYKLRVWFINHQLPTAMVMHSTKRQDRNNNAFVVRMKDKILNGDWKFKVNHATFYQNGDPFLEYTDFERDWHTPEEK